MGDWEPVYTIDDYYDGPRAGATEFAGNPFWYRSVYLDAEWDSTEDGFELTPISREVLNLALERHAIFERWDEARKSGIVVWTNGDDDSFGALPNEMQRYRELNEHLDAVLANTEPTLRVRGRFAPAAKQVRWEVLERDEQSSS